MQFYKGQNVSYLQSNPKRMYYGKVTRALYGDGLPGGTVVSVLWDTDIEHDYYGNENMLKNGKIKAASNLQENNPNRRFVEDEKKI